MESHCCASEFQYIIALIMLIEFCLASVINVLYCFLPDMCLDDTHIYDETKCSKMEILPVEIDIVTKRYEAITSGRHLCIELTGKLFLLQESLINIYKLFIIIVLNSVCCFSLC